MKNITEHNFALISTFARELARNLRTKPFPVEVVGGAGAVSTAEQARRHRTDGEGRVGLAGKKGRQTEYMEKQRKAFLEYLKEHPETASVSRITRARECWAIHRREWNAAAKKGIGYSDYKALSRAKLM